MHSKPIVSWSCFLCRILALSGKRMWSLAEFCTGGRPAVFLRTAACLGLTIVALATLCGSGPVTSVDGSKRPISIDQAGSGDFEFYLEAFGTKSLNDMFGGRDPVEATDLRGTPYTPEVIDVAGWKLGRWRRPGPHLMAMQNPNLSLHMAELEKQMVDVIPVDFAGLVIIDYEAWWALWERTLNKPSSQAVDAVDLDFKDDWREYIREYRGYLLDGLTGQEQELVYERTYEAFVKTFLLATYYKCKQLRPRAKWGYYNYPQVLIHSDLTPSGVQGYGDLTHQASRLNDQMQWLFEAVDFVAPRIFPARRVLEDWPPDERQNGDISPTVHEAWLRSIVRESVRLANGKPVYPIHSAIFFTQVERLDRQPVDRFQHEEVFRIAHESGAAGVITWHAVADLDELATWERLWPEQLRPAGINADREINGSGR